MNRALYEPYLCRQPEVSLKRVGFFDDGLSEAQLTAVLNDKRWVTPTHHLKDQGVVLCTTGAFSPFHQGHLRMLEIARAEAEKRGLTVAGALVQPDHDGYVSKKRDGSCACPASERIYQAQLVLKDHPWIQVDPWPSLYQDRPLNYTTILRRTQRYLGRKTQVVYVFGSDNAGFADAFLPHEYVCIGRPGAGEAHPEALDISSTQVRKGVKPFPTPTFDNPYLIRDDLNWATAQWGSPPRETTVFWGALWAAFCDATQSTPAYVDEHDQREALSHRETPYISFDRVTGGPHWVSRIFHASTLQDKPFSWLSSDLGQIPAGKYALVDDDIASGATVEYIKQHTPQVEWTDTFGLAPKPFFDAVDARDFLFGSRCGGLMIRDGEETFRAPYITPWVNLTTRAKIAPMKQPAFVQAIIRVNLSFFEAIPVTVAQTDNPVFWQRLGYSPVDKMSKVCMDLLTWNPN